MASLFLGLLLTLGVSDTQAQHVRPDRSFFVSPQVGVSSHLGPNSSAPFSFAGSFPYSVGLEAGYQFFRPFDVSAGYRIASYPDLDPNGGNDLRQSSKLLMRYRFGGRSGIAPYLHTGAHLTFGKVPVPGSQDKERSTAYGPLFGLGFDIPVSNRLSLFLESTTKVSFDDKATASRQADFLSSVGTGLRINFHSGRTPVTVMEIGGPDRLEVGQTGTFRATTNHAKATKPITYNWDLGDGTSAEGLTATHSYSEPGTYQVMFTASNRGGLKVGTKTVVVTNPPVPARITTLSAEPQRPDTRTPVRFHANVQGDAPVTYRWDFGDGNTASGASPTHTYSKPGTYTVTLNLSNTAGSDTRTIALPVAEPAFCGTIAEMNAVFFDRHSSVLTDQGRAALRENLEILRECSTLSVRIEGIAAAGERNAQRLSEDRARAVEQFYRENGMEARRLTTYGRGIIDARASKKTGLSQYQRADTIPTR